MILQHKLNGKFSLLIAINFMYSKDIEQMRTMHSKSDNIEIMIGNKKDEIIQEIFDSILQTHQKKKKKKETERISF